MRNWGKKTVLKWIHGILISYLDKLLSAGDDVGSTGTGWMTSWWWTCCSWLMMTAGDWGLRSGSGSSTCPQFRGAENELQDADDHEQETTQEPDVQSVDVVGGRGGGPGDGDHVEEDDDDQQLETETQQHLGDEEGEPGDDGEEGGGEEVWEQVGCDGALEEYLHPVHAVVPWHWYKVLEDSNKKVIWTILCQVIIYGGSHRKKHWQTTTYFHLQHRSGAVDQSHEPQWRTRDLSVMMYHRRTCHWSSSASHQNHLKLNINKQRTNKRCINLQLESLNWQTWLSRGYLVKTMSLHTTVTSLLNQMTSVKFWCRSIIEKSETEIKHIGEEGIMAKSGGIRENNKSALLCCVYYEISDVG